MEKPYTKEQIKVMAEEHQAGLYNPLDVYYDYYERFKMDTRYVHIALTEQELTEIMKGLDNNSHLKKILQMRGNEVFGW